MWFHYCLAKERHSLVIMVEKRHGLEEQKPNGFQAGRVRRLDEHMFQAFAKHFWASFVLCAPNKGKKVMHTSKKC